MALRPEIAGLDRPVRSELSLNVQQVLHGVRRGVVIIGNVGVRRRYLENGPISAGDGIVPNQARISNIRCERYSSTSIACQVEVHGVSDVLCVENTPAATDHVPVIERVRKADARSKVLVLGFEEVVIQSAAADRFRVSPMDIEAGIWVRAVALPDEIGPLGLRSVGRKPDLQ